MELESKLAFGGRVLLHVLRGGRIGAVRPYFICGCGHSGTTIVANILAGHPRVYTPLVETNAFLHGPRYARRTYLRLVLEASLAGKRVLIEKTPRHIRHLDLLRATVKNAKLIIPVRDGRDVAASITARFGNDLQAGINRWISDNQIVAAQLGRPDVFFFRYEDFVESPAGIISEICAFLGLPFSNASSTMRAPGTGSARVTRRMNRPRPTITRPTATGRSISRYSTEGAAGAANTRTQI